MNNRKNKLKFAVLVGDGMADFPIAELGGKTPLAFAATPNMDRVAAEGVCGMVATVPDGVPPGSDVANLSLMGYDPLRYYRGRAPIEAASMGVALGSEDTALRCNLVCLKDGLMHDYSGGHFDDEESHAIIAALQERLGGACRLYPGVDYRHLLVMTGIEPEKLDMTPPHDITGRPWKDHLPKGPGAERCIALMDSARGVLVGLDINKKRAAAGATPATDIWLWGQGRAVALPSMKERYGLSGSVVSAVDLVRGLGVLAGLRVRRVPGATGYLGTNYAGKVAAARDALADEDLVYLHVEAPDETSHEGSLEKKLQAIGGFDANVVGPFLDMRKELPGLRILVAPDHATPVSTKTHAAGPVPFTVCGMGVPAGGVNNYCETSAAPGPLYTGVELFDRFIKGTLAQP